MLNITLPGGVIREVEEGTTLDALCRGPPGCSPRSLFTSVVSHCDILNITWLYTCLCTSCIS